MISMFVHKDGQADYEQWKVYQNIRLVPNCNRILQFLAAKHSLARFPDLFIVKFSSCEIALLFLITCFSNPDPKDLTEINNEFRHLLTDIQFFRLISLKDDMSKIINGRATPNSKEALHAMLQGFRDVIEKDEGFYRSYPFEQLKEIITQLESRLAFDIQYVQQLSQKLAEMSQKGDEFVGSKTGQLLLVQETNYFILVYLYKEKELRRNSKLPSKRIKQQTPAKISNPPSNGQSVAKVATSAKPTSQWWEYSILIALILLLLLCAKEVRQVLMM